MLRWLYHKFNHGLVTLRVSILAIFITLFVLAILIVTGVTYTRFSKSIETVSFKFMQEVSSTVYNVIINEINDVAIESKFSANLIERGIINPESLPEIIDYTYDLMRIQSKTLPSVQSAFWGDESGNFVLASKLENQTIASDLINRKKREAREVIFRNMQGIETHHNTHYGLEYDPRVRPWYTMAKEKGQLIWTDVYPYRTGLLGITAATPVFQDDQFKGVFALNVGLDFLRNFLEKIKVTAHGVVYLVNDTGKIIAYPGLKQVESDHLKNINDVDLPWIKLSFELFKKDHQREFTFRFRHKNFLAVYTLLPEFTPHVWYVGVVAPEEDFTNELLRTNYLILFLGIFMLLCGIVLMSMLVNRVVRPLKKLVRETENIKNFNLHETPKVHSRIKEVLYLSRAIAAMKNGLRAFQRYVPASLVRNLIESGKDSTVGGEKKELAIFFSDIEDFTRISEHMDPDKIMAYLCDYFNELTHIIIESQGTVDKYMGDSLMAFWGAPLEVKNPCVHAAQAALQCHSRLKELEQDWKAKEREKLKTRIGLHFGEVVVGNLGSMERLSYTAVGDAINVASRLEDLNKIYGTQIIVSEAFYQEIKDQFILRKIDNVVLKGKDESINIYELIAENRSQLLFDLKAYEAEYNRAFSFYELQKWDQALHHFKECLKIYPFDNLVPHFIKRIEYLKKHSPGNEWDGVWRYSEK